MEKTAIVAWWGAILSSLVFLWDIYKWRTAGPKLRFTVSTGMRMVGEPKFEGKTLITLNVANFGDRPTTLMNVALVHYQSKWAKFQNRPDKAFVVSEFGAGSTPPIELKQGGVWMAQFPQDGELTALAVSGFLICDLYHSHREKPLRRRVVVRAKVMS